MEWKSFNIQEPLETSKRIKYSSFDASKNYIIFGATSGGIYIFKRIPNFIFTQLIPGKEGEVTRISISPCENFVAITTSKLTASILEFGQQIYGKAISKSEFAAGIVSMAWCESSVDNFPTLIMGDAIGRVYCIKISFLASSIFNAPTVLFAALDSPIVQISSGPEDFFLVSTMKHCYLCDVQTGTYKQIGQKSRNGEFGACFLPKERIFCARPGARLWEADLLGNVKQTHQLKRLMNKMGIRNENDSNIEEGHREYGMFANLFAGEKHVVGQGRDFVWTYDVENHNLLWHHCSFSTILAIACVQDMVYVWTKDGEFQEVLINPEKENFMKNDDENGRLELLGMEHESEAEPAIKVNGSIEAQQAIVGAEFSALPRTYSVEIIEDTLSELGVNLAGKFQQRSKDLKEKWNEVNPFRFRLKHNQKPLDVVGQAQVATADMGGRLQTQPLRSFHQMRPVYQKIASACAAVSLQGKILAEAIPNLLYAVDEIRREMGETFKDTLDENILECIKETFQASFQTRALLIWVQDTGMDVERDLSAYPAFLRDIFTQKELRLDLAVMEALKIFSSFMDQSNIVHNLNLLKLPCHYESLNYILEYFEDAVGFGQKNEWPLPVYLNSMRLLASLNQTEAFCKMCEDKNVEIRDILYTLLKLESATGSVRCRSIFSSYATKLCAFQKNDRFHGASNILDDPVVFFYFFQGFFKVNEREAGNCCHCGFPRQIPRRKPLFWQLGKRLVCEIADICVKCVAKSSQIPLNRSKLVTLLSGEFVPDFETNEENLNFFCLSRKNETICQHDHCKYIRSYIGVMDEENAKLFAGAYALLWKMCEKSPQLWKAVAKIQMGSNVGLIPKKVCVIFALKSEQGMERDEARRLMKLKATMEENICPNCSNVKSKQFKFETISWTDLALVFLKEIGPENTLDVLREETSSVPFKLEKRFYQSLVCAKFVKNKCVDEIINVISSKGRIDAFPSEVMRRFDLPPSHGGHHWGFSLASGGGDFRGAYCFACSLPLFQKGIVRESGIVIFTCCHTYHTVCLINKDSRQLCLVCKT